MSHSDLRSIVRLFSAIWLLLVPVQSFAQESSTSEGNSQVLISLAPKGLPDGSRFEVEIDPGGSTEMVAVMQNYGTEPIELRTYITGIDAVINGGLKISDPESEPHGSTQWLGYEEEEFVLQPGESLERVISVHVPENTPPGQYVNAISMETVNPINEDPNSPFTQYLRKVVSIYVQVSGEIELGYEFGEPEVAVSRGRAIVSLPITNTGNTRLDLVGVFTVSNASGDLISEVDLTLGPIYMHQETFIQTALLPAPPPGVYDLSYTLMDRNTETVVFDEVLSAEMPEEAEIVEAPVRITNVAIEPNAQPMVFANVTVDLESSTNFRSTKLTLSVFHDGTLVEDFVLADNLSLPQGVTTVSQRYLPLTEWETGTYTFSLKLESTEDGQKTLLSAEDEIITLEVP